MNADERGFSSALNGTMLERTTVLLIQNVSKTFDNRKVRVEAVKDFSLEIYEGELMCIVGSSGCGKSTLLNMLAGFIQPSAGKVMLHNEEIVKVEPRCGMIFQAYALFPWKTVKENIEFGLKMKGTPGTERRTVSDRYIKMVGLEGFEHSYPSQLSGGMRQRVALARVLANDPEILLMDEPFAALDAMTRQVMQEELVRIQEESRKTVVFVTHNIEEAVILSDRIAIMSARPGRLKQVLTNPLPKPRDAAVRQSAGLTQLKEQIWELVREEVLKGMR
jgi:NitT/TauT family transport system ATP-binding protein